MCPRWYQQGLGSGGHPRPRPWGGPIIGQVPPEWGRRAACIHTNKLRKQGTHTYSATSLVAVVSPGQWDIHALSLGTAAKSKNQAQRSGHLSPDVAEKRAVGLGHNRGGHCQWRDPLPVGEREPPLHPQCRAPGLHSPGQSREGTPGRRELLSDFCSLVRTTCPVSEPRMLPSHGANENSEARPLRSPTRQPLSATVRHALLLGGTRAEATLANDPWFSGFVDNFFKPRVSLGSCRASHLLTQGQQASCPSLHSSS